MTDSAPAAAQPPRIAWRLATVVEVRQETPTAHTLALDPPAWPGHRAGQHVDVRLTAEDGYQAQRSYSIASAPEQELVELTIQRLPDGEVSTYLVDELRAGDELELRGPIGGWFQWRAADGGPLLLVAGGSGIVPLAAMVRHRAAVGSAVPARLLVSAQTRADVFYRDELEQLAARGDGLELVVTLTRERDPTWTGRKGRVNAALLGEAAWPADAGARTFVCGPTGFVETVADTLVGLGHDPGGIRTERFGPTGT